MDRVIRLLSGELKDARSQVGELKARLKTAPAGRLYVSKSCGRVQYYLVADGKRTYLSKSSPLVAQLARKKFDEKCLATLDNRIRAIVSFLRGNRLNSIDDVYRNLKPEVRSAFAPPESTKAGVIAMWKNAHYSSKAPYQENRIFETNGGDMVRSKSEKIIVDELHSGNALYLYEYPLELDGFGIVYPDYTIYDKRIGGPVYWEHFGMMDNPEYLLKMTLKYNAYVRNKLDDRLIMTFESSSTPLDISVVRRLASRFRLL